MRSRICSPAGLPIGGNTMASTACTSEDFTPGHAIHTGLLTGQKETPLTALLVTLDSAIPTLENPHGKVALLLLVGVDARMRKQALDVGVDPILAEISAKNPDLVTRA